MDRLAVDDEMRERVLAQVDRASAASPTPRFKATRARRYLVPAACIAVLIAGVLAIPAVMPAPESAIEATSSGTASSAEDVRGTGAVAGSSGAHSAASSVSRKADGESTSGSLAAVATSSSSASAGGQEGEADGGSPRESEQDESFNTEAESDKTHTKPSDIQGDSESTLQGGGQSSQSLPQNSSEAVEAETVTTMEVDPVKEVSGYASDAEEAVSVATAYDDLADEPDAVFSSNAEDSASFNKGASGLSSSSSSPQENARIGSKEGRAVDGGKSTESDVKGNGSRSVKADGDNAVTGPVNSDDEGFEPETPPAKPEAGITEISSAAELSSVSGLAIADIPSLASEADHTEYRCQSQGTAEIEYTLEGQTVRYCSGIEDSNQGYPVVKQGKAGDVSVTFFGGEEGFLAASWEVDGVPYSLTMKEPVKKAVVVGYVSEAARNL